MPHLTSYGCWFACLVLPCACLFGQVNQGEVESSEAVEELIEERREMQHELRLLRMEQRAISQQIKVIDQVIAVRKHIDEVRRQLQIAEMEDDRSAINRLKAEENRLEQQVESIYTAAHNRERDEETAELNRLLVVLKEHDVAELAGPVISLKKWLVALVELEGQMSKAEQEEDEETLAELEHKFERLEMNIEFGRRHVRLLQELELIVAESGESAAGPLLLEIEELMEEFQEEVAADDDDGSLRGDPPDPRLLPVPITPQHLRDASKLDFDRAVVDTLRKGCFECHNNESQSGELDLERLLAEKPFVKNRRKWVNVIEQLKNRVMPPAEASQLTEYERTTIVHSLHRKIHTFDYSTVRNPGYEPARRLTHDEYDNTVRDLFGMDLQPTQKFPADLSGNSGFENSANTLFIQPLLMERYMGAAESVVRAAFRETSSDDGPSSAVMKMFATGSTANAIEQFLTRAYRRPVTDQELQRTLARHAQLRERGFSKMQAAKLVCQTALVSPNFLMKSERSTGHSEPFRIDDWELANRLSYFLWASMPDARLFELAKAGKLHEASTLRAEVDRMIDDVRSSTLGSIFAAQWLGSINLGTRVRLDPIDNPWCTESLMTSMREETAKFFHSLVVTDRPLKELITADYTFLNEELAKLYQIDNVVGDKLRKVSLETPKRGGILGHGSVLAVTSFPYRTSPVVRGHWVLETLLGTPPPPPPPNVSQFAEDLQENDRLSPRKKLEQHRRAANCFACHSQIDPIGFSLEGYDWFGRSRRKRNIDVRGRLPNGTEFEGLSGLKSVLVEQRIDDFHRQLASKMLSYALGRQLEYYDEVAIRKILRTLSQHDFGFRTLIHAIVDSYPFQYKQMVLGDLAPDESSESD